MRAQTEMQRIQHHRQDRRPKQETAEWQYEAAAGVDQQGYQPDSKRNIHSRRARRRVIRIRRIRVDHFCSLAFPEPWTPACAQLGALTKANRRETMPCRFSYDASSRRILAD